MSLEVYVSSSRSRSWTSSSGSSVRALRASSDSETACRDLSLSEHVKEVPVLVVQAEQDASGVVHCGVIGVELVVHPTAEILGGIEPFSGQR